jgi:hypothetical protein
MLTTLMKLSDTDKMPIGKAHKGTLMEDVPADYLLWFWDIKLWDRDSLYSEEYFAVHDYIKENFQCLMDECKDHIATHLP